jgi:pimeloyl-ACP methyl ester carboxylesterase
MRLSRLALLALVCLVACQATPTGGRPSPSPSAVTSPAGGQLITGSAGGAAYVIRVPAAWNRTLILYSHGYVAPGQPNPAPDLGGSPPGSWFLDNGFAITASSYSGTGWALAEAFKDQIALLDLFSTKVGAPTRTIAIGHSLGGIISAGLVQLYPERFAAALPMCGVLAGSVGTWNLSLDGAFAFKTLLAGDARLQLVGIADPIGNLRLAMQLLATAHASPAGQARLALVAALGDEPGWFDPRSPEPAAGDYSTQADNQFSWASRVTFPYLFALRADVEQRAGGNPSWNVGVDYRRQLDASIDKAEVVDLYRKAGVDLDADLAALAAAPRVAAEPAAVDYMKRNIVFDGKIGVPVLALHTTGDGLVPVQEMQAYAATARSAGKDGMLRQLYVHRAGHCSFTASETIAAFQALVGRIDSGRWDDAALALSRVNQRALALGDRYNLLPLGTKPQPPAFADYSPGAFLRPFDAASKVP